MRKGNITASFSWVFMAFVGIFFIFIAYNVVSTYQENQEELHRVEFQSGFQNILSHAGRTAGVEDTTVYPVGELFMGRSAEIVCEAGVPLLSIDGRIDPNNRYIEIVPSFSTYIEQGNRPDTNLLIENFNAPFRTTNLFAFVSLRNQVVFDSDSSESERLAEKFEIYQINDYYSESFSDDSTSIAQRWGDYMDSRNLLSVTFVTENSSEIKSDLENEVGTGLGNYWTILELNSERVDENRGYGNFTIYDSRGENATYPFIDWDGTLSLETVAIFSRPDNFNCSFNLLMEQSGNAIEFYRNKAILFHDLIEEDDEDLCAGTSELSYQKMMYEDLNTSLANLSEMMVDEKLNNTQEVYEKLGEIRGIQDALYDNSCRLVY